MKRNALVEKLRDTQTIRSSLQSYSKGLQMNTAIIPLNGAELVTAQDENRKVYVAMKPVVDGMGLEWARQNQKIKDDTRYVHMSIPYQTVGGLQEMTSLPLDQLAGWLYSINPNKVRADIKQTVIDFQQETFNVINAYWQGETVSRQQKPLTTMEMIAEMATRMAKLERVEMEQQELKEMITHEHKRANRLENNIRRTITDSNHFTIIAYANLQGINLKDYHTPSLGRKAKQLSEKNGIIVTSVPDSKYGKIGVYHKDMIIQAFAEADKKKKAA